MNKFENREVKRHHMLEDLSIMYEGTTEEICVQLPDLSTGGMFIPTQRVFPIGSVLKVEFRLPRSKYRVKARAEVRHVKPGAGVGVEFIGLSAEAARAILAETGE